MHILALMLAVSGAFHFGQTKFQPADAIAWQVDGKDGKPLTLIAFADFKIDRQEVMEAIDPVAAFITQINANQKGNFVIVRLSAPDRCGLAGFVGNGMQQIDVGDSFTSKASVGVERVAGRCSTSKPGKMFDDAYDFDLSYDLPLTVVPKPSKLPSGGGEPGAAYAALVKAIQAADWNAAHLHLRKDEVPETKPKVSEMKEYFRGVGLNYPKTVTVTGGLIKGDRANLDIKGMNYEDKKIRGVVVIRKFDGNWRVLENNFFFEQ